VEHQREIWRNYYRRRKAEINAEKAKRAEEKKQAKLAAMPVKTPEEIEKEAIAREREIPRLPVRVSAEMEPPPQKSVENKSSDGAK
jgi:hypothetical protein